MVEMGLATLGTIFAMGLVLSNLRWWRVNVRETTLVGIGLSLGLFGEAFYELDNAMVAVVLLPLGLGFQLLGLAFGFRQIVKAVRLYRKGEKAAAKKMLCE